MTQFLRANPLTVVTAYAPTMPPSSSNKYFILLAPLSILDAMLALVRPLMKWCSQTRVQWSWCWRNGCSAGQSHWPTGAFWSNFRNVALCIFCKTSWWRHQMETFSALLALSGIHRSSVNSPHKGQWRVALILALIGAWINGWVNNCEAGDLRRHRAHYNVTVMIKSISVLIIIYLHIRGRWLQSLLIEHILPILLKPKGARASATIILT